ncbi:MAG TPA: RNA polymerase sigma factor, partial [Ktedonobacterales bacterium]
MAIVAIGEPSQQGTAGEVRLWDWLCGRMLGLMSQFAWRAEQSEWSATSSLGSAEVPASIQSVRADAPDLSTFDEFYTRHEQALYGYLRRLTASHEVAVELAQESFVRAWRHFDRIADYDRPEAWLFRVATN